MGKVRFQGGSVRKNRGKKVVRGVIACKQVAGQYAHLGSPAPDHFSLFYTLIKSFFSLCLGWMRFLSEALCTHARERKAKQTEYWEKRSM